MMLFQLGSNSESVHWTEIYVIVVVSAALMEEVRKVRKSSLPKKPLVPFAMDCQIFIEFHTQMLERWHRKSLWILTVYATPYILFYVGIGLHFASMTRPTLFTPARCVNRPPLQEKF